MNQKCKVCGEPAAGFHFGAFTCEGCKVINNHHVYKQNIHRLFWLPTGKIVLNGSMEHLNLKKKIRIFSRERKLQFHSLGKTHFEPISLKQPLKIF